MLPLLPDLGSGSGSALPLPVLLLSGIATLIATIVSATSIFLHLKNYRKPILQRMVIRIMVMVPLYAIASFISLFSLQAAFFIDAVRDIYEAFVIYCFFDLLVAYLGGERSLLILLHGRPPKYPVFPGSIFWREVDVSDPYTFLFLKRGVLQYVQVKPILALATIILKATGKFREGDLRADSGYLYVSLVYNLSICMSLYCLAIFWMCVNDDLKPFRPMPKFLCVKGILFFSFWQSLFISILVAAGAIIKLGPYTDAEHISLGLTDTLICLEMPFFAIAHQYAFSVSDFIDPKARAIARMPIYYAVRDAFGVKDVVEDSKATLRGQGMDYREFEPSEGVIHQGAGRDRRIRAGLRYSQGGKRKYWLPQLVTERSTPEWIGEGRGDEGEVYAPLLEDQAEDIVHSSPDLLSRGVGGRGFEDPRFSFSSASGGGQGVDEGGGGGGGFELPFGDVEEEDEEVFEESRKYVFGDYNYPCVDVSSEEARMRVWDEEERILRDERGVYFRPTVRTPSFRVGRILGREGDEGYGATGSFVRPRFDSDGGGKGKALDIGSPGMRQTVIDKEQDRAEEVAREGGGLKLQWTRTRNTTKTKRTEGKKLLSPSPILTPRLRTISSSGAGSSSSSSGGAYSPSLTPASRVLPPDAVDLVVEDYGAAEEEMTNERRKGEPAVRGSGLRKVYRRGYVIDHDHDDPHQHHYHGDEHEGEREVGEVEVDLNGEGEEGEDSGAILRAEEEVVETIARVQTPPAYAQVPTLVSDPYFHSTGIVGEVDNPWA